MISESVALARFPAVIAEVERRGAPEAEMPVQRCKVVEVF